MSITLYTAEQLRKPIPRPSPDSVNSGLVCPTSGWFVSRIGSPELKTTQKRLVLGSESIHSMHVYGARVARVGLRHVLDDVKTAGRTDLIQYLHTEGMYNLRKVRGSTTSWSTHSFGFAADLNYGPGEDMGDNLVQFGLMQLYPYFHARQWYWGGGYKGDGREDGMHFEPSVTLIESWISQGLLVPAKN